MGTVQDRDVAIWVCPEGDPYDVIEFSAGGPEPKLAVCGHHGKAFHKRCAREDCQHRTYHPSDFDQRFHRPCGEKIPWAEARHRNAQAYYEPLNSTLVGRVVPELTPDERQDLIAPPSGRLPAERVRLPKSRQVGGQDDMPAATQWLNKATEVPEKQPPQTTGVPTTGSALEGPTHGTDSATMLIDGVSVVPDGEQRAWLQLALDHFLADATWPREADLQLELDRADIEMNIEDTARSLPRPLGSLIEDQDRRARVTVRGLLFCTGAERLLDQFIRAVELFARKYLEQEKVTRAELRAAIQGDDDDTARVFQLLQAEQYFLWSGNGPEGEWSREVDRRAREFRKVHTLKEYIEKLKHLEGRRGPAAQALFDLVDAQSRVLDRGRRAVTTAAAPATPARFDAFIVHASSDKDAVARPLAAELQHRNYHVWFDEWTLKVGDSLREKIDEGLRRSRYGVVILSPGFFSRSWPRKELDGLAAREANGAKVILPVWHSVNYDEILAQSPLLAGRMAALASDGIASVADKLAEVLGPPVEGVE